MSCIHNGWSQWRRSGVFIVNCELVLHLVLISFVNFEHAIAGWVLVIFSKSTILDLREGPLYTTVFLRGSSSRLVRKLKEHNNLLIFNFHLFKKICWLLFIEGLRNQSEDTAVVTLSQTLNNFWFRTFFSF